MLRTMPERIMTHSATLREPNTTDEWGVMTYTETSLSKVHIQPTHTIVKSADNKEVNLNATLFYDPRVSLPVLDWNNIFQSACANNAQLKVSYQSREYTVFSVDLLPDDEGKLHHVEVLLY